MKDSEKPEGPAGSEAGQGGETFKREGPAPATNDSGGSVDEMNREAEESLVRNVEPDQPVD
jgi:hypothetical protein